MERVGALIGPVVGGVVASVYGGQYTFVLATGVLLLGLVPLLKTKEPVRVHQKLDYKHFDVSKLKRQYVAFAALGVDNTISIIWWALFLGAFVFVNNAAYAQVGLIVSFSVGSAIIAARIIGRHIDAHRGRVMLRFFVGINSVVHLVRPFASSYFAAFSVNVLNDVISVGYRMPFLKGMYDSADDLPGYRIVFISSIESFASVVKAALWWCLAAATMVSASKYVFAGGFVVAAIASIVIRIENFSALAPRFDKKRIKS
jgi:MFS family permease